MKAERSWRSFPKPGPKPSCPGNAARACETSERNVGELSKVSFVRVPQPRKDCAMTRKRTHLCLEHLESRCVPATITVNTSNESVVGDNFISLREAIYLA